MKKLHFMFLFFLILISCGQKGPLIPPENSIDIEEIYLERN